MVRSGATRLAGALQGPSVAILMYHSVMEDPRQENSTLGGIVHSREVFTRQMELISREYVPVSLDEVMQVLEDGQRPRPRSVVVTFDDGYTDNHEIAMPILNRVGIPATFYITVDCVEKGQLPWPGRLRYAFSTTNKISWNDINGKGWPLGNSGQREQAFLFASDLCARLAGGEQENFVEGVQKALQSGPPEASRRLMMTWEGVRHLLKNGHIIGSHTLTHPNMAHIGEAAARWEMADSKRKLEEVLKAPVLHFSYPCPALWPHWNESTRKLSREVGYRTAVTTVGGRVRQNDDLLALKRVRPSKEVEVLRWNLECTFLGRKM